ncbi:MAG: hypothetical protein IKD68_14575, partial [Solobacterium sp.]|nr:hypothetical protein [Solobacterium sp.]
LSPRYFELRNTDWSDEAVLAMLEDYEKDIFASGAYARDVERWPESDHQTGDQYDLSEFKDYVIERLHYCDAYFEEGISADR